VRWDSSVITQGVTEVEHNKFLIALLLCSSAFCGNRLAATGHLDTPKSGAIEAGLGMVAGWICDATSVTIEIDGTTELNTAFGIDRNDTIEVCGDSDNGFALPINFSLLGSGEHSLRVLANGLEFARTSFSVVTLDMEPIRKIHPATTNFQTYLWQHDKGAKGEWREGVNNLGIAEISALPFTYDQLLIMLEGTWSGTWRSRSAEGTIGLQLQAYDFPEFGRLIGIRDAQISGTGCAGTAFESRAIGNWSDAYSQVIFSDGSAVSLEFMWPAFNNETLTGTFLYNEGPCAGVFGSFTVFKQR
jgi:hypothetical protein